MKEDEGRKDWNWFELSDLVFDHPFTACEHGSQSECLPVMTKLHSDDFQTRWSRYIKMQIKHIHLHDLAFRVRDSRGWSGHWQYPAMVAWPWPLAAQSKHAEALPRPGAKWWILDESVWGFCSTSWRQLWRWGHGWHKLTQTDTHTHTDTETACGNIDWRHLMTNHSCSQFVTACPCQLGRLWQEVLAAFVYISVDYRMLFKDIWSCSKLSKMFPPICFICFILIHLVFRLMFRHLSQDEEPDHVASTSAMSSTWSLPRCLRRYRRLLLGHMVQTGVDRCRSAREMSSN